MDIKQAFNQWKKYVTEDSDLIKKMKELDPIQDVKDIYDRWLFALRLIFQASVVLLRSLLEALALFLKDLMILHLSDNSLFYFYLFVIIVIISYINGVEIIKFISKIYFYYIKYRG